MSAKKINKNSTAAPFEYKGSSYVTHNELLHHEIAIDQITTSQKQRFFIIVGIILIGVVINWHSTVTILLAIMTALYAVDVLFNLFLIVQSLKKFPEVKVTKREIEAIPKKNWPTYTILCPLYHETAVLPQFVMAISKLDYDFSKLQVLLLLEEDDVSTVKAVRKMKLPKHFKIIVVPDSSPKTKPKACNYGLKKATGEYIVIYDAEDAPDPRQLKKAYIAFQKSGENVVCIQSKLNFYNPHQNILTRAFTAEYSTWFDLVLTGLQVLKAPIPLGGTSNHFKTETLRKLGGWDAFNVTEDADLGMRLARRGYRTEIIDSVTLEEANSSIKNWFWQRTRWIKGYIQTYLVHTRKIGKHADFETYKWRIWYGIVFRLTIGGKVFMMFVNPFMWALTISYFAFRPEVGSIIQSFYPAPVLYVGTIALVFGNFLYFYYYMIGCAKHGQFNLIKYVYLVPIYWLAMSVAAWRALYELFARPYHWSKTKHGLHLDNEHAMREMEASIQKAHGALTNETDEAYV